MNILKKSYIIYIILFFCLFCTNNNNNSDNNFLAYYNTFYSAEISFAKAVEIIDSNNDADKIPNEALLLLDNAIRNSNIIIEKYYNTEYIDDAYYIIGRASIFKNRISVSSYYFNRIIDEYPTSEYFYESYIWLGFIYKDLNDLENLNYVLETLEPNKEKLNDKVYLFYVLLAEIDLKNSLFENAEKNYLLAIDYTSEDIIKKNIYIKLLDISDSFLDYEKSLNYIYGANLYSEDILSIDLLDKWFEYSRITQKYNSIYDEINTLIKNAQLTDKEKLYYSKQKGVTLLSEGNYLYAENLFKELVDEFEGNRLYKLELCELYYYLGFIEFHYNSNFLDSKEYFDKSNQATTSKTNKFWIKSKLFSDKITVYLSIQEEYIYLKSNEGEFYIEDEEENNPFLPPMPTDVNDEIFDSLLYRMGEILYFDLNNKDSAAVKFNNIVTNFPNSSFAPKSLFALAQFDYSKDWLEILKESYPNSIYVDISKSEIDVLDIRRDSAWALLSTSKDGAVSEFMDICNISDDPLSCYIIGFIYDEYIHDPYNAVKYYNQFIENFPLHDLHIAAQIRVDQISVAIDHEIDLVSQTSLYCTGLDNLKKQNFSVDTLSNFFIEILDGPNANLDKLSDGLLESLIEYNNYYDYYNNYDSTNIEGQDADSLVYNLARIMFFDFNNYYYTNFYGEILLNDYSDSRYIPHIYTILNIIKKEQNIDTLVYNYTMDSIAIGDIKNFRNDINKFLIPCDLNKLESELNRYKDMKDSLFLEIVDDVINPIDSITVPIDTIRLNTKN